MWNNTVEPDRPRMTIWRMRIVCWIHKATNKHTRSIILNAFPLQQWLNKRTSLLRYKYNVCIVSLLKMGQKKSIVYEHTCSYHSMSAICRSFDLQSTMVTTCTT